MISFTPAAEFEFSELAALFNDAFNGYVGGDVQLTPASFARFVAQEGVDLSLSDIAVLEGKPAAFALIARQGWTSRLAAMGVAKAFQGQGAGNSLLAHSFEQACSRRDRLYVLECIEQNERGVRFYRAAGFNTVRRLFSFRLQPGSSISDIDGDAAALAAALKQIDIPAVARYVADFGALDLPWQISGFSLSRLGPPNMAFNLGPAYVVVSSPELDAVAIRSFFVLPDQRSQGYGRRLWQALIARFPERQWLVPAVCPEEYGGFFQNLGFEPDRLSQFQMEKACGSQN